MKIDLNGKAGYTVKVILRKTEIEPCFFCLILNKVKKKFVEQTFFDLIFL